VEVIIRRPYVAAQSGIQTTRSEVEPQTVRLVRHELDVPRMLPLLTVNLVDNLISSAGVELLIKIT
jgi:hypothetical protein